jgi:SAM-dependent methyltransferase
MWWETEVEVVPAPAPTFGFAWQRGMLAPFLPADIVMSTTAITMAAELLHSAVSDLRFADFGCGDGAVVLLAASLGMRAYGIDLDEELLATARRAAAAETVDLKHKPFFLKADVLEFPVEPPRLLSDAPPELTDVGPTDAVPPWVGLEVGVDVLFWHMLPEVIPRHPALDDKLRAALHAGCVVITVRWKVPLRHWDAYLRFESEPIGKQRFFLYAKPTG